MKSARLVGTRPGAQPSRDGGISRGNARNMPCLSGSINGGDVNNES